MMISKTISYILYPFLKKFAYFWLKDNCATILYWFLPDMNMLAIKSSPRHQGNPCLLLSMWLCKPPFLSLPSPHPFPPLETLSLRPLQLIVRHQSLSFTPSLKEFLDLDLLRTCSFLRTLPCVRSCQAMAVFLSWPSYQAACGRHPSPFMAASCLFTHFSPIKSKLWVLCYSHLLAPPHTVISPHFILILAPDSSSLSPALLLPSLVRIPVSAEMIPSTHWL